jgi:hypothetical protein
MLDRERIEKQEKKAGIVAIVATAILVLILSFAINLTGRCAECGKYVHRWQPIVYTSDGCIHHYGCLEDKYHKEAGK